MYIRLYMVPQRFIPNIMSQAVVFGYLPEKIQARKWEMGNNYDQPTSNLQEASKIIQKEEDEVQKEKKNTLP